MRRSFFRLITPLATFLFLGIAAMEAIACIKCLHNDVTQVSGPYKITSQNGITTFSCTGGDYSCKMTEICGMPKCQDDGQQGPCNTNCTWPEGLKINCLTCVSDWVNGQWVSDPEASGIKQYPECYDLEITG